MTTLPPGLRGAILFVPGDQPRRMSKALSSSADAVVLDLEDSVTSHAKDQARTNIADIAAVHTGRDLVVRLNKPGTPDMLHDLAALEPVLDHISAVVLPKVEVVSEVEDLAELLAEAERRGGLPQGTIGVAPVIETARGLIASEDIARGLRVVSLIFGTLDLAAELGVSPTVAGLEFLHARSRVVLATRAAGLGGPIDGPHADLDDQSGLEESTRAVHALGFGGRVVIHPGQIETVRSIYTPSPAEIARATHIIEAYERAVSQGIGAVRLEDGTFVERPVAARAAAVLGIPLR